ncbi:MAG TPA: hypothetical protein ENI27_10925 [bacterium]|nr:hypothetical protein [bacterium]
MRLSEIVRRILKFEVSIFILFAVSLIWYLQGFQILPVGEVYGYQRDVSIEVSDRGDELDPPLEIPVEQLVDAVFVQYEGCIKDAMIGLVKVLTYEEIGKETWYIRLEPREALALCRNDANHNRKAAMKQLNRRLRILRRKAVTINLE